MTTLTKRKHGSHKNSVAERIRRMFAQGVDLDEIAKRTGSRREYVMTVTHKLRLDAEEKFRKEVEGGYALVALYAPAPSQPSQPPALQPEPESKTEPEAAEVVKPKINYHNNRVKRTKERITSNLVLSTTHLTNPDRAQSSWRYEYRSPITKGKRSKFLGTLENMSGTQARTLAARYNKIVANGRDPFPLNTRAVGWFRSVAKDAPIVVPSPVAERVEEIVADARMEAIVESHAVKQEEPAFVPPFLKETPIYKNEQEYLAAKGGKQVIKPVPPEISEPVKARVKRVVKPKPLPEPNPTVWGRVKAKLRGWLA